MRGLKRITLVIFILIGSVSLFGYWSFDQFNQAFDNLSAAYLADAPLTYSSIRERRVASSSLETIEELATSTDSELASTSPETSTKAAASTDPTDPVELSFTFPEKDTEVYIGCTYPISWQSSGTVSSLETALVDAGTREPVGPKTSGISKENIIAKDLQKLEWKVGYVWPGAYYIKISKINAEEAEIRSKIFIVNKTPENISADEQKNTCKESGGI